MPPALQTLLLRVLEDGSYNRVSEWEKRRADIRLVCETARDLPSMVERGEFRKDLYYRIRGACVTPPPLRRRSDIVELAEYLLAELCEMLAEPLPAISRRAVRWIRQHDWPGNVRELKNAFRHALVLTEPGEALEPEHVPDADIPAREAKAATTDTLRDAQPQALKQAQEASDGNISKMARRLGVARTTVYRMLERHGLN